MAGDEKLFNSFELFDRFACSIGFASPELVEWLIESIESTRARMFKSFPSTGSGQARRLIASLRVTLSYFGVEILLKN